MTYRPQTLSFDVGYTTDDVVRATHRSADERDWEREQRSKRRTHVTPRIPDGPCCARCEHWSTALGVKAHLGRCGVIGVLTNRIPPGDNRPGYEKGHIFAIGDTRKQRLTGYEALRTGPAHSCADGVTICPLPGFAPAAQDREVAA